MHTIHSIMGGALIAATLPRRRAIADVPDRPEATHLQGTELHAARLRRLPVRAPERRPVYMAPSNEFPLVNITFSFKGGAYLVPTTRSGSTP